MIHGERRGELANRRTIVTYRTASGEARLSAGSCDPGSLGDLAPDRDEVDPAADPERDVTYVIARGAS